MLHLLGINKALKAEAKKVKPNRAAVVALMDISFEMRRNEVLQNPKSVKMPISDYPFLGDYDEVSKF